MASGDYMKPERFRSTIVHILEDMGSMTREKLLVSLGYYCDPPRWNAFNNRLAELVSDGRITNEDGLISLTRSTFTFPDDSLCDGWLNATIHPLRDDEASDRVAICCFEPRERIEGIAGGGPFWREFYRAFIGSRPIGPQYASYNQALMRVLIQKSAPVDDVGKVVVVDSVWRLLYPKTGMARA
jgi:hypothetical protein